MPVTVRVKRVSKYLTISMDSRPPLECAETNMPHGSRELGVLDTGTFEYPP